MLRSAVKLYSRTSSPSILTTPSVASYKCEMSFISVDLPDPVEPRMARVSPGAIVRLIFSNTGLLGESG